MSGKINLVRNIQLSTGCYHKKIGELNKGEFTDVNRLFFFIISNLHAIINSILTKKPAEIENQIPRQSTMYSFGVSEVIILESYDLVPLRQNHHQMPIEFLHNLEFFKTYPFENLQNRPDFIMLRYFGY